MTKLNWGKAKRWEEPAYPHLPLKEYLEQYSKPLPFHPQLYEWDMDKYHETMKRERDEEIKKQIKRQAAQQAKAYYNWLNTSVHCQGCGKKRKPKDNHTIKCDTKKLQTYGWYYGEPYPIQHSEETLAKQAAQKAYRQTSEYKEELKRRRKARKTQKHIIERKRNAKLKKRVKEGKQNG